MLMRPGSPHGPSKPEPLAYAAYAPRMQQVMHPLSRLKVAFVLLPQMFNASTAAKA